MGPGHIWMDDVDRDDQTHRNPANPILSHFNMKMQNSPIQGIGHADLVQAPSGKAGEEADITEKAIELLDNPAGFFMMVEGGAIDWAGHANEAATNLYEVLALDDAVRKALAFMKKHPDETLIVVTGDHETGGMTMGFAGAGQKLSLELLRNQKCSVGIFKNIVTAAGKRNPEMTFEDAMPLLTRYFGFQFQGREGDPMRINAIIEVVQVRIGVL